MFQKAITCKQFSVLIRNRIKCVNNCSVIGWKWGGAYVQWTTNNVCTQCLCEVSKSSCKNCLTLVFSFFFLNAPSKFRFKKVISIMKTRLHVVPTTNVLNSTKVLTMQGSCPELVLTSIDRQVHKHTQTQQI